MPIEFERKKYELKPMLRENNKPKQILSLQGFRAILFLLIFVFHTSMIGNVSESTLYRALCKGGGTEGVAFFFILSGFVEALHSRKEALNLKNVLQICVRKAKRFYTVHIFFLLVTIPTMIYMVLTEPTYSFIKFVLNALLLQSWFPDEQIWLSYNSVTWFLSTLVFLCLFIIPLHHVCSYVEQKTSAVKIYAALLAADCLMTFAVAFLLGSRCKNVNYYLYAFPPIRLLDYFSGFVLGRTFVLQQNNKTKISAATYWEVVAVGVMVLYLLLFPYVPVPFVRAAIYQPGAAFVIYVIAAGAGKISRFLSNPLMVKLGEGSLYYMMSHQVIIQYCSLIHKQLIKREITSCEIVWIIIAFASTLISRPIYEGLCLKFQRIKSLI